jgi:hypothetical protein
MEAMEKHIEKQLTKRWENNEKSWKHILKNTENIEKHETNNAN